METLFPGLTVVFRVTVVLSDHVELELISACPRILIQDISTVSGTKLKFQIKY